MFLVVPHRVTETTAEIFVGAFFDQEPPEECRLLLEPVGPDRQRDLYAGHWSTLSGDGKSAIHYLRRTFSSLPPATAFDIRLLGPTGELLARGSVETMPASLPLGEIGSGPDRPFTLWLSSCFYSPRAASGLEQMVKSVVRDDRIKPHLKILAGDQVYLDFPQSKTVLFGKERLRRHFNEVYTSSWTHPAFSELLCNGGNVFLADDHELWNNYPDSLIPRAVGAARRRLPRSLGAACQRALRRHAKRGSSAAVRHRRRQRTTARAIDHGGPNSAPALTRALSVHE
jgi:hypothetical protein